MVEKLKPCPFLKYGEKRMSATVSGEYTYSEYFKPCAGKDCAAFDSGFCLRNPYVRMDMRKEQNES